ncbi:hypothetical protein B0H14DRAFT_3488976 [Mycena olivaceomarginata]|nr:hypothetical protein B0H14DRAFT_3488976 [Mycena olivaceomarginata]
MDLRARKPPHALLRKYKTQNSKVLHARTRVSARRHTPLQPHDTHIRARMSTAGGCTHRSAVGRTYPHTKTCVDTRTSLPLRTPILRPDDIPGMTLNGPQHGVLAVVRVLASRAPQINYADGPAKHIHEEAVTPHRPDQQLAEHVPAGTVQGDVSQGCGARCNITPKDVPALRKRLEGESRVLSKRISLIEDVADQSPRSSADRTRTQPAPRINGGGAPKQRTHTYSQPKLSEIPNSKPRTPDPSPRSQYQTRIPKAARGRTGSITTNNYANGYTQRSDSPADLRRVNDAAKLLAKQPSQDTIHIPLQQTLGLLNEPAPFGPLASAGPSSTTSHEVEVDVAPPRPSNDSEERPFEHWYRGEVSRNGSVGELKLGKRAEMLEIANYGHTLKQKQVLREAEASNQQRRKRSESTAGIEGQRGSLYLDEEENGYGGDGRVLDEGPLTNMDNVDVYEDQYQYGAHDTSTASVPLPASSTPTPTQTPSRQHGMRIPSPCTVTPTPALPMQRGPVRAPRERDDDVPEHKDALGDLEEAQAQRWAGGHRGCGLWVRSTR